MAASPFASAAFCTTEVSKEKGTVPNFYVWQSGDLRSLPAAEALDPVSDVGLAETALACGPEAAWSPSINLKGLELLDGFSGEVGLLQVTMRECCDAATPARLPKDSSYCSIGGYEESCHPFGKSWVLTAKRHVLLRGRQTGLWDDMSCQGVVG